MVTDLGTFLASGHDLQELPGVGKAIGPTIQRIMRTGHMPELDKLSATLEPSVAEMASRPALDPKTVTRVYKQLKINTLTELQERLEAGEIREKLGQRVDFQIRQGLADRPRMLFKRAFEFALKIEAYIKAIPDVTRVEMTGSLRRRQETIGDLNFLVAGNNATKLFKRFQSFAGVESSEQLTDDRTVYRLSSGFEVTLHWTSAETWGLNWILTTGSAGHLEDLNQVAANRKLELTASRLTRRQIDMANEADVYHALGMPFIEPELREGRREIDAAQNSVLPHLIRVTDIQGDLHMHTTASDGVNSIAEMAAAAQAKGYKYIAITDHSRSLKVTNGLSEERLREHIKAIDKLNSKLKGFTVLKSAEVDILEDGSLD
jgi:DNA polymerase (family 10)